MKNAQIWKLANSHRPIVKIEYTIYELQRLTTMTMLESDAGGLWNGNRAPKGSKMLAIIKVPANDAKSALWALKKWTGT